MLRGTLAVLAVAVPAVSLVLIAQELRQGPVDATTIGLSAYTLVFPSLWLVSDRLGFRATAMLLLGLMCVAALTITTNGGVAAGNISLSVLVILLGGFLFGRPGAAIGLVSVVGLLVLGGVAFISAGGAVSDSALWNQLAPDYWLRQAAVLALLGLAVAVMQVYVVERLADEARVVRRIAEREQQQRLALERADREREHEREQRMLAQQALEQSRRMEAVTRLAGGVAHDFNNALTVIVGNAEYAKASQLSPEEVRHAIDEIGRAAHGAADLTRKLLTVGRAQVAASSPVLLGEVLGRLRGALRSMLPDDVALQTEPPPADACVWVDSSQLERALFNLVLNARDAMPRGGTLRISVERRQVARGGSLAPGRYVTIAVSDDGVGMDADTLEHIFEPFFTTKGEGSGTGLGLATVYTFARQAGGDVQVRSAPGEGATFTMILPEFTGDVAPAPVRGTSVPLGPARTDARVLVVEDREDVRSNIVRVLTRAGFAIREAADGEAALRMLTDHPDTDLMCIDGVMPGLETAVVIERALAMSPSLRVLVCSAYVQEDLLRRGLETGRYPFLAKPFTTQALLDAVHGALAEQPLGPAS